MNQQEQYGYTERRYVLSKMPSDLDMWLELDAEIIRVYRNYLNTSQRYSKENGDFYLGVKDLTDDNVPPSEMPISEPCFKKAILGDGIIGSILPSNVIHKLRYVLPKWGNFEIHKYKGNLSGLVILECDLSFDGDASTVELPPWVQKLNPIDVTDNPDYDEKQMSYKGKPNTNLFDFIEQ